MTPRPHSEEWGIVRHLRELITQVLTVSGMMLTASVVTTVRVLTQGPEWAAYPAIIWSAMQTFNHTGRWVIPPMLEKFFAAKYGNGAPKPP